MTNLPTPAKPGRPPVVVLHSEVERLAALGLTVAQIAARLGVSRQTLHDVLAERQPVTPNLAARLGKLFGNGAGFWIRMQAEHDVWRATDQDVSAIETLAVA